MQSVLFYAKHTDTFMSPKHRLLPSQIKVITARGKDPLGIRYRSNAQHLQHSCNSFSAVLLPFLEDIA